MAKTTEPPPGKTPVVVGAAILVFLLIHFITSFWPSVKTWGIDYWSEIPLWGRLSALAVGAIAFIPNVSSRIGSFLERRLWGKAHGWIALGVALALFLVLRSRGLSYGDGYSFSGYFPDGQFPELTSNLRLFAGDLAIHWAAFRISGLPIEMVYAILSAVAGVCSLWAIVHIANSLFPKDRPSRWFVVASGCSSAMVILWFGYVEAYSLVNAAMLWSMAFAVDGLQDRGMLVHAWLLWLVAVALHLMAIVLLPMLIVLTLWKTQLLRTASGRWTWAWLIAGFISWGAATLVVGIAAGQVFVPLATSEVSNYTAFSLSHVLDTWNLAVFAAPLGLIALLSLVVYGSRKPAQGQTAPATTVLGLAAASLWFFSFWVDPLIGGFRDWDLLGAYGIPLSLWGGCVLARSPIRRGQWLWVAGLALVHSVVFAITLQDETQAMLRVDRMVREDPHYQRDFHRGERLASWAFVQVHIMERYDLAADHLGKRALWEPRDRAAWKNLGSVYWYLERLDSAAFYFEASLKFDPADSLVLSQLGLTYARQQNWEGTKRIYEQLSAVRPLSIDELNRLAFADLRLSDSAGADSVLAISIQQQPVQQEAYYYRAWLAQMQADTTAAIADYELALAPGTDIEDVYMRCAQLYQARGQWDQSVRIGTLWVNEHPRSAMAHFILGMGHFGMRAYDAANQEFARTLEIMPTSALANYYGAATLRHLGNTEKARELALRSASIDSNLALPYLELVYLAADAGDHDGAVAATRQYLRRAPHDSGMAYLQQFMEPQGASRERREQP